MTKREGGRVEKESKRETDRERETLAERPKVCVLGAVGGCARGETE